MKKWNYMIIIKPIIIKRIFSVTNDANDNDNGYKAETLSIFECVSNVLKNYEVTP